MSAGSPSMLKPALIGGTIAGVAAGLPGLNFVNSCTCCSFVVGGGFLAAYLHASACKGAGVKFDAAAGALTGLLAGVFYGIATAVVASLVFATIGDPLARQLLEWIQRNVDLPPDALDVVDELLLQLEEKSLDAFDFIKQALLAVGLGAVFSTLGGLIGGAVFKSGPPGQPEGAAPPPAPPA